MLSPPTKWSSAYLTGLGLVPGAPVQRIDHAVQQAPGVALAQRPAVHHLKEWDAGQALLGTRPIQGCVAIVNDFEVVLGRRVVPCSGQQCSGRREESRAGRTVTNDPRVVLGWRCSPQCRRAEKVRDMTQKTQA